MCMHIRGSNCCFKILVNKEIFLTNCCLSSSSGHPQAVLRLSSGHLQVILRSSSGHPQVILSSASVQPQFILRSSSGRPQVIFSSSSVHLQFILRSFGVILKSAPDCSLIAVPHFIILIFIELRFCAL